ncbi:DUF5518 domain-containing protein [Halorussus salilacus]|uniref:DUF5518 domain-containing protein n=1 Tax=Halorussus salilacus TaxID=2953750 RepID=UPI00209F4C97|nr:DUF5518 domain-containing protein [Halorussus salilacus]USZ66816.1 DUF5518 domain-containing protein [Halorussus salilacus]
MDRETTTTRTEGRPPRADERRDDDPNTLLNALIGAVVTVITAPLLPFAAIFGGAAAGYLQRGDFAEGAKIGAISGAIAAVPAVLLVWLVFGFFLIGADPLFGFSVVIALVVFFFVASYLVGAGALGGALGAYLRREL